MGKGLVEGHAGKQLLFGAVVVGTSFTFNIIYKFFFINIMIIFVDTVQL